MLKADLQSERESAPKAVLQKLALRVYCDLPCGSSPADESAAVGLNYVALAAKLSGEQSASVGLHALALHRLLEEEGIYASIYRFGLAGFVHAAVLALSDEGLILLDSFTGVMLDEPIWAALDKLSQGKSVRAIPLGRARKICRLDPRLEPACVIDTVARAAERELVGAEQRVFSLAWGPEIYLDVHPPAQDAMMLLGRLGEPRSWLQLLLYPVSPPHTQKAPLWLESLPVIGSWFAGEDLPDGQALPFYRLASRDRVALAATLMEVAKTRLEVQEMQERDVARQALEDMARAQMAAGEAKLTELLNQVTALTEERDAALDQARSMDQRLAQMRAEVEEAEGVRAAAEHHMTTLEQGAQEAEKRASDLARELKLTRGRAVQALAAAADEAARLDARRLAAEAQAEKAEAMVALAEAHIDELRASNAAAEHHMTTLEQGAQEAEKRASDLARELKLTRGRAVQALAAVADEAARLDARRLAAEAQAEKAEAMVASAEAHIDELRASNDADRARWESEIAGALRWVEESRNEIGKERQARQEAEARSHDSQRRIQKLQKELAEEHGRRELDLRRSDEGRRLTSLALARLEREAETLRAALLGASKSSLLEIAPAHREETVAPGHAQVERLDELRAQVAALASERDAMQAALDSQAAVLARSRYMRFRAKLLRLLRLLQGTKS